jgi:nucleotide-binding universal stress UspA family protein
MKQILVPCDFSPAAIEAYKFALRIAAASGKAVTVLHAIDIPVVVVGFDIQAYSYDQEQRAEIEAHVRKQFTNLESACGVPGVVTTFDVRTKGIAKAVRDIIDEGNIELVVMGTNGTEGLEEVFVGSNTERVVRHSTVPVISVRKAPVISSIRNILFPNHLGPDQEELVNRVVDLQRFFNATLRVLWVNTPMHFLPDGEAMRRLRDFAGTHHLMNYVLEVRSDITENDGIRNFVRTESVDLIAMGTHGRKGLAHLVAGSIAEDVVNHIECPVWTYALPKK